MMRLSRTTLAFIGGAVLFSVPLILFLGGGKIGNTNGLDELGKAIMRGAEEFSSNYGTKQLVAGILLFLIVIGFMAAGIFYVLICCQGVILLLILRELHEIRERIER